MNKTDLQPEHLALIDGAIQTAFPNQPWSVVAELGGGLSTSILYQVAVGERNYVARITAPDDPQNDLAHEHAVMTTVDSLGIAPRLYYTDAQHGIALTDFVASQSLLPWREDRPPLLPMLAGLVRTLHQGPALPRGASIFDKAITIYGWLPPAFQAAPAVVEAVALMQELAPLVRDPAHLRPGHGDINPGNLLFGGTRLWLIDWASAGQENFYFDLACCTNFFFYRNEEVEAQFLQRYFERDPTADEAETYARMSVFCAIYYGLVFLYMSGLQGAQLLEADVIAALPDYPGFMGLIGEGVERLDSPMSQQRLGFVYLQRAARLWSDLH